MNNIAYQKRDIKSIKKREKLNFLFKATRIFLRNLLNFENKQIKTISTFPIIKKQEKLIEIVNKIAWAYPKKKDLKIYIHVSKELMGISLSKIQIIPYQRNYLYNNLSHITLVSKNLTSDLKLCIDMKALLKINNILSIYKVEVLDKNFFSTNEGGLLASGYYKTFSLKEKDEYEKLSKYNFSKMLNKNQNKNKAYCFVTGPSFDKYKKFVYEKNSLKIICNSIVKNNEFLEYIEKPDILAFADPVFHFSSCEYAAKFRDNVIDVVKKYQCFVVVPEYIVPLLLAHYPILENFIIGMKKNQFDFNFPSIDRFYVKGSENILTLFMLPIASSISNEINILGADGRNPNEKYFWQHSSSAQYDDLMYSVFETHPSFFRDRDYKDYYEEHCGFLENLIQYGEKKGKKYFSLTKSYIPALKKRYKKGKK